VAIISVDNGISAVLLDTKLIGGTAGNDAGPLLGFAASIYLTNIITFGIWYWELDRDGPLSTRIVHTRRWTRPRLPGIGPRFKHFRSLIGGPAPFHANRNCPTARHQGSNRVDTRLRLGGRPG